MREFRLALAILGLCAASAGAAVYKWVDPQGVTQYSDFPPAAGEATEIRIAPAPPPPEPVAQPVEGNGAAAPLPEGSPEDVTPEDLHARYARSRAVQCAQVHEMIRVLQIKGPVWRTNDPAGEEVLLTNEERAAQMELARQREAKYCSPVNP